MTFFTGHVLGFFSLAFWVTFPLLLIISIFLYHTMKFGENEDERTAKIHEKAVTRAFEIFGICTIVSNYIIILIGLFSGEVAIFMLGITIAFILVVSVYTIFYFHYLKKM
jgi:uncharacterized membrane protein